ncbi:MFS transporter [Patescibacteria group bacterium]|nr:MFS transporter [Patescibacteria group bacterium]MCL5784994.1 MFS transporter [Patescibacteria group bacterium]
MNKLFSSENNKLIFILVTMFLNFLGFSILFPILPFMVEQYVPNPHEIALYVGLLLSVYAFCQFFAAPGLGALSDRFGRKPILLISLFGSAIGYILLGIGGALWVLFLGRIIDGLTGGNISTIFPRGF